MNRYGNILIVDDEEIMREILETLLTREGYQVRLGSGGQISARATAHGGYSSGWSPWTGWYRVSGGSHAGQIVPRSEGERRTPSRGVELVPLAADTVVSAT